jgi:hypothetical protein
MDYYGTMQAIIKRFPDTSGCQHNNVVARRGGVDIEMGQCIDCGFAIAFHIDKAGHRTGRTEIVQLETVPEDNTK